MDDTERGYARFHITAPELVRSAFATALACAAFGVPAALGQTLDATLTDIVNAQVDQQVEQQVQQQVESAVTGSVQQQVESAVTGAVEQQVASQVGATVEQQVESQVVTTIEQQVESGVTEAVAGQVEDGVADAVEGVAAQAGAVADQASPGGASGGADGGARAGSESRDSRRSERFFAAVDSLGRTIERNVWLILVPSQYADRIAGWGFTVRERRALTALGRVLLRVDAPEDRDIAQAALDLAADAPGTRVDFNHVYRATAERDAARGETRGLAGKPLAARAGLAPAAPHERIAIGLVDSAVAAEHEALRGVDIVQRDFVRFDGARPKRHGTAVASILVGRSSAVRARLPGARLYAASVFFADHRGEPAATTAGLVTALEWLVTEQVTVINMSLAGPPNSVLEAAVDALADRGAILVAAVGNNGPVGAPLYPAAYARVVGVTAVDSENRIYRYANRGPQVMFAAPGVKIRVARSDGGYATETGTSMAAPYAAAIIAQSAAARRSVGREALLATLQSAAIDLGAKSFDPVFGFGLIAAID